MHEEEHIDEVLDLQQRKKRAMIVKKNKNKLRIARKIAQRKKAPKRIIHKRAFAAARKIVRRKFAGKLGADYENLSPSQKINVDRQIAGKQKIIKKIAMRLMPRIQQAEAKRLQSFLRGAKLDNLGKKEHVREGFNESFDELLTGRKDARVKDATNKKNKYIKFYKKFSDIVNEDSSAYRALQKKSDKSGIDINVLGEVFTRGLEVWKEQYKYSPEQYAFARVNSYVNRGKSYFAEDRDLHEFESGDIMEVSNRVLKNYISKADGQSKPHWNKDYHAQIKKDYGDDDPEVKTYDRWEKKRQNREDGVKRATKKLGGSFDKDKHSSDEVAKSKATQSKYKYFQKTPHGNGYIQGHDSNKKDHVIISVPTSTGIRTKSNPTTYKEVSVHKKHLQLKENEKLNEVSDDLKNRYIKKAKPEMDKKYDRYNVLRNNKNKRDGEHSEDTPNMAKIGRKAVNRDDGIYRAQKSMKEAWTDTVDKFGKRIVDPKSPCKKGFRQKGVTVVNGKEVPRCTKEDFVQIEEGRYSPEELQALRKRASANAADLASGGKTKRERERQSKAHDKAEKTKKAEHHLEKANSHHNQHVIHKELANDSRSIQRDLSNGEWKNHGFESKEHARGAEEELAHQAALEQRKADHHKSEHDYHAGEYKYHSGKTWKAKKKEYKKLKYSDFVKGRNRLKEGKMSSIHFDTDDMDNGNFKKKYGKSKGELKSFLKHSSKKIDEMKIEPKDREIGTDSSVENYKKDTPGQDQDHKKVASDGGAVKEGKIEGIPIVHTNASDYKNVKVTTPNGKVIWRKQKKTRDIIK